MNERFKIRSVWSKLQNKSLKISDLFFYFDPTGPLLPQRPFYYPPAPRGEGEGSPSAAAQLSLLSGFALRNLYPSVSSLRIQPLYRAVR